MKKGFTLIELLAVIVILAVIALIATPIILNIIEDSKKQSIISSANLYIDGLVKQIATKNLTNEFNPSSCTVLNGNVTCDNTSLDYQVNGSKPTSGTVTFNNGIVTGYTLCISDYKVTKTGNNVTTTQDSNCTVVNNLAYTPGDLVQYDPVNNSACTTGNTCYNWRVITVGDTAANNNITLQMDHNLINRVAWTTEEDYGAAISSADLPIITKGPLTIFKELETATSSWNDSLKLNYTYVTPEEGSYGTLSCVNGACTAAGNQITTNLKARIITGEEIAALTVNAGTGNEYQTYVSADEWTMAGSHFYFTNGHDDLAWLIEYGEEYSSGYWTLTPWTSESPWNTPGGYVWITFSAGYLGTGSCSEYICEPWGSYYFGARPVITISKSIFE